MVLVFVVFVPVVVIVRSSAAMVRSRKSNAEEDIHSIRDYDRLGGRLTKATRNSDSQLSNPKP